MRMPMMARSRVSLFTTLVVGALFVGACAGDATAPSSAAPRSSLRISSFQPGSAAKALYGVSDGVYSLTLDPSQDQSLDLGSNHLDIPANSICAVETSSYGPEHWNDACDLQTDSVTITVTIEGANGDHPRLDFQPAMRFSPDKSVQLYMYSPSSSLSESWILKYCNALNECSDESKADADLQSYVDQNAKVVFRRIKHFSGYLSSGVEEFE